MGSEDRPKESTAMSNKSISWCLKLIWDIAIGLETNEAFINDADKKNFSKIAKNGNSPVVIGITIDLFLVGLMIPKCQSDGNTPDIRLTLHPWLQGSWGQHGAHLGPTGPRWTPCWPHELCYLGYSSDCILIGCPVFYHFIRYFFSTEVLPWFCLRNSDILIEV